MPLQKNQTVPVTIANISSDGNGVGRVDGLPVFVPGSAVQDELQVKIVKYAKKYAYGKIQEITTPGPGRQTPDCPIAGVCGGCCFRHLSYEAELEAKRGFVCDALERIGKLEVEVPPVIPAPSQNRYRNKVQYPIAQGPNGMVYGFYAARSHRVVENSNCLLQPTLLNQIAAETVHQLQKAGFAPYSEADGSGLIRHIYMRQGQASGQIMLCIVALRNKATALQPVVCALTEKYPQIHTILLNINPKNTNVILGPQSHVLYGPGFIQDSLCGVPLQLGPHSFAQVNSQGAEKLFALARQYAALQPNQTLVDLYCGAGVIGLSMAAQAKKLVGVEIVQEAVQNARQTAAAMGLTNTEFLCEDAGSAAQRFAAQGLAPDVITVDPPRKGCSEETLQAILAMAPRRVVMVSCNPATLARDLAFLTAGGYHIAKLQPVDMFPRTKHVECVALLSHKSADSHINVKVKFIESEGKVSSDKLQIEEI